MRFVPVKTAEQQATALLHRGREQLVRQRTMLVNALRAHLAEFGMVAAQGLRNVGELIAIVRDDGDTRLPDMARQVLQVLANQIEQIETAVAALERQLLAWHKSKSRVVGLGRPGLAARWFRGRSSDRIHGQLGWFNLSARAGDGGFWRWQRRSRRIEYRPRQCRHITTAIADDTAALMSAARR